MTRERIAEQAGIISGSIMSIARSIVEHRSRDYEIEESFLKPLQHGHTCCGHKDGSRAVPVSADLVCGEFTGLTWIFWTTR